MTARSVAKISEMAQEPNWSKRGAFATWTVGAVASVLWIVQYVRPPDPNHPMSFDFLSRSISIPPWLALLSAALIAFVAATAARRRSPKNTPPPAIVPGPPAQVRTTAAKKIPSKVTVDKEPDEDVVIPCCEDASIHIRSHKDSALFGLIFNVQNTATTWLGEHSFRVADATSWDEQRQAFRESRGFQGHVLISGRTIEPGSKTEDRWLIKTRIGPPTYLSIGNDEQVILRWPNNDHNRIQTWWLTLTFSHNRSSEKCEHGIQLVVKWDVERERISITECRQ